MTGRLRTIRARIVLLVVLVTVVGLGSVVGYATWASHRASAEDGRRYGVEVAQGVDPALVLAITVVVDAMTHPDR